jgi:hypothetical protein
MLLLILGYGYRRVQLFESEHRAGREERSRKVWKGNVRKVWKGKSYKKLSYWLEILIIHWTEDGMIKANLIKANLLVRCCTWDNSGCKCTSFRPGIMLRQLARFIRSRSRYFNRTSNKMNGKLVLRPNLCTLLKPTVS